VLPPCLFGFSSFSAVLAFSFAFPLIVLLSSSPPPPFSLRLISLLSVHQWPPVFPDCFSTLFPSFHDVVLDPSHQQNSNFCPPRPTAQSSFFFPLKTPAPSRMSLFFYNNLASVCPIPSPRTTRTHASTQATLEGPRIPLQLPGRLQTSPHLFSDRVFRQPVPRPSTSS